MGINLNRICEGFTHSSCIWGNQSELNIFNLRALFGNLLQLKLDGSIGTKRGCEGRFGVMMRL